MDDTRNIICPGCDEHGHVAIQVQRMGGYSCRACGHEWVEDVNDDSTWAIRAGERES